MRRIRWFSPAAWLLAIASAVGCSHVVDETDRGGRDPAEVWEKNFRRGWNLHQENLNDSAERRLLAALHVARDFPEDDPRTLDTRVALALVYRGQGRYETAENELRSVLPVQRRVSGSASGPVANVLTNLGVVYLDQNRHADAVPVLYEALRIRTAVLGPRDPSTAVTLEQLATAVRGLGRHADALHMYEQAFEIFAAAGEKWEGRSATVKNNLALLYRSMGRQREAEVAHLAAIRITRRVNPVRNANLAIYSRDLANLYAQQERYREATERYEAALSMFEKTVGESSPHLRATLLEYSAMLSKIGYGERASELRERAASAGQGRTDPSRD